MFIATSRHTPEPGFILGADYGNAEWWLCILGLFGAPIAYQADFLTMVNVYVSEQLM